MSSEVCARKTLAPVQNLQRLTVHLLFSSVTSSRCWETLKWTYSRSGVQAGCRGQVIKCSLHMCSQAAARPTVLTVLLEDPDDCFVHMLLQFGTVNAEATLERESKQTASF